MNRPDRPRSRASLLLLLLALVVAGVLSTVVGDAFGATRPTDAPAPTSTTTQGAATVGGQTRTYRVTAPNDVEPGATVVVYLHGCSQDAADAEAGTGLSAAANARGWIVVYPEQPVTADPNRCWRWFDPAQQQRSSVEPTLLATIARDVVEQYDADPAHVHVAGGSAGGYMASVLGATYPDVFRSIAVVGGGGYGTGLDVTGALARNAMGIHARVVPSLVLQGTADPVNVLPLALLGAAQWRQTSDLVDDGLRNGSVQQLPSRHTWAAATDASYGYSTDDYRGSDGDLVQRVVLAHGAGHAFLGGNTRASFTDARGPGYAALILDFFAA